MVDCDLGSQSNAELLFPKNSADLGINLKGGTMKRFEQMRSSLVPLRFRNRRHHQKFGLEDFWIDDCKGESYVTMSKVGVLNEHVGTAAAAAHVAAAAGFHNPSGKMITKWEVSEVCAWLNSAGFGDMSPIFQKHQISGPVLPKLNDAVLREMGVEIVGRRVLLMNEICKVQAMARAEWRNHVVWANPQYREGPCNGTLPFGFPFSCDSCVGLPNMYTLTNSKLNITRAEKNLNTPCTGFCGFTIHSDNIDLSDVTDVDVRAATAAFGDPTGVLVVSTRQGNCYLLQLRSSECQKTSMLLTNAKEEAAALSSAQAMSMMR
jgi:hypothetical protein